MPTPRPPWQRAARWTLRLLAWGLLSVLLLFFVAVIVIRTPWAQAKITSKATLWFNEKTGANLQIDRLFVTFSGNILLEGVSLPDAQGDTLVFSESLEAGLAIKPLLRGKYYLTGLQWTGLRAHLARSEEGTYNFDFIAKAFSSPPGPSDTISTPFPEIHLGPIHLQNMHLSLADAYSGTHLRLHLGDLALDTRLFHWQDHQIHLKKLSLTDTRFFMELGWEDSPDPTPTETLPLGLIIEDLTLKNITYHFSIPADSFHTTGQISTLNLGLEALNLADQQVAIRHLSLEESHFEVHLPGADSALVEAETPAGFQWPEWKVTLPNLRFDNVSLGLFSGNIRQFGFQSLSLQAAHLAIVAPDMRLQILEGQATEIQGFQIRQLEAHASISDSQVQVHHLVIQLQDSELQTQLAIQYPSLNHWLQHPEQARYRLALSQLRLGTADLARAAATFAQDTTAWWADTPISVQADLDYHPSLLQIHRLQANRGLHNRLLLGGEIHHPLQADSLYVHLPSLFLAAKWADWEPLLAAPAGIQWPDSLQLSGTIKGNNANLATALLLQTPNGRINLKGKVRNGASVKQFAGDIALENIHLGKLLNQEALGLLTAQLRLDGSYSEKMGVHFTSTASFGQLYLAGYNYQSLEASVSMRDNFLDAVLHHHNHDLQMDLRASALLDSLSPTYTYDLHLLGADFQALGQSATPLKLRLNSEGTFRGHIDDFNASIHMSNGLLVQAGTPYSLQELTLTAMAQPFATQLVLESELLEAQFGANAAPSGLAGAFTRFIKGYFDHLEAEDLPDNLVKASGKIHIRQTRLLSEVLVPDLTQLEPVTAELDFDEATKKLRFRLSAPFIQYAGNDLHGLYLRSEGNRDSLGFDLGFEKVSSGAMTMYKTHLHGNAADNLLSLVLQMQDEKKEELFHLTTEVTSEGDTLRFHLVPSPFVLNGQSWELHPDNEFIYHPTFLQARQCAISRGAQQVSLRTDLPEMEVAHLGLTFDAFQVATLTSILNPENNPLEGILQGSLVVEQPLEMPVATAALQIQDLHLLNQLLGNLQVKADHTSAGNYRAEMTLKGEQAQLSLDGTYATTEEGVVAKLQLHLHKLGMPLLAGLSNGTLKEGSGYITGQFSVTNTPAQLSYQGQVQFKEAQFTVTTLNAPLRLSEEVIQINQDGLTLERFQLIDAAGNRLTLRGSIRTPQLTNPDFDMQLTARNFLVLNSTRQDNDLFFGKALIDAEVKMTGNLARPRLEARTKMNRGSHITVIVPESELDVIEREGVVLMVNMQQPDDIMTRTEETSAQGGLTGLELRSVIQVDPATILRILLDERSGDYLEIAGEADLSFDMNPNGQMALSGVYELRNGVYEMSLYNIVKRKFELVPGSRITWSGDPVDATMDLSAKYRLRTSPAELMAEQLAGVDASVRNRYRQELPFEVLLKIKGSLLRPEISFGMDMPENQRGALGGNVYGRIQQLNNTESELNKQVFGLLVMGKFFPEGNVGPQEGEGTSAMARSSVSQVLSGQLNTLSKRYIKGVELDMDLDSFTDYQSGNATDRTQLNLNVRKSLFSERVVVQLGSQLDLEGRPDQQQQGAGDIIGDVSVEYLLTEDGRYRMRGFRKNQFEGMVEGQLIITGLSLIFNKEFNKWAEAFKKEEKEKKEAEDKPNDSDEKEEEQE